MSTAYGTFLSGLVVSVIITLFHAVDQLKATRQELARSAVAQERLRFSRDLHDLLGHTLSVIVVKSEAARRLAPRDLDAALAQVADIEAVGRQALTEIREAVTGYREGCLSAELDRARSALTASDIELRRPGVGPAAAAADRGAARLGGPRGRHQRRTAQRRVPGHDRAADRPTAGPASPSPTTAPGRRLPTRRCPRRVGTGLRGLGERLAAAGGSLASGPAEGGGFRVAAVLPVEENSEV